MSCFLFSVFVYLKQVNIFKFNLIITIKRNCAQRLLCQRMNAFNDHFVRFNDESEQNRSCEFCFLFFLPGDYDLIPNHTNREHVIKSNFFKLWAALYTKITDHGSSQQAHCEPSQELNANLNLDSFFRLIKHGRVEFSFFFNFYLQLMLIQFNYLHLDAAYVYIWCRDYEYEKLLKVFVYWLENTNLLKPETRGVSPVAWAVLLKIFFLTNDDEIVCLASQNWINFLKFCLFEINDNESLCAIEGRVYGNKRLYPSNLAMNLTDINNSRKNLCFSADQQFWTEFKVQLLRTFAFFFEGLVLPNDAEAWDLEYDIRLKPTIPFKTNNEHFFSASSLRQLYAQSFDKIEFGIKQKTLLNCFHYFRFKSLEFCFICRRYSNHLTNTCFWNPKQPQNISQSSQAFVYIEHSFKLLDQLIFNQSFVDRNFEKQEKFDATTMIENINLIANRYNSFKYRFEAVLYGSSYFSEQTNCSDVDISLNLIGSCRNFNEKKTLLNLSKCFRRVPEIKKLQLILNTRKPLLRFKYKVKSQRWLNVDLTLESHMAIQSSKLIRTYFGIDFRVEPLVHLAKHFAKINGICPRKTGGLSSYAVTLMMIYYLQNVDVPVLPNLQAMGVDLEKEFIDDCDVTFMDNLFEIWSVFGLANNQSLASLFLGFLYFYAYQFDFIKNVISIRCNYLLKRSFRKSNDFRYISIQDPFILDLDLAHKCNLKMHTRIHLTFDLALKKFCNNIQANLYSDSSSSLQVFSNLFLVKEEANNLINQIG